MSFLPVIETPSRRIPPEGDPLLSKMAFCGEAGGEKEEREQRPFVGASGTELNRLMHSAGILRSECYITNVIKEHPPGNDIAKFIDLSKKTPILTDKAKQYIEDLREELLECRCNVIVALGDTALYALTGQTGITKWRGSILESTLVPGLKVVPTFHPRTTIGPTGMYLWRYHIIFDMQRAKEESQFPEIRAPHLNLITAADFQTTMDFLAECNRRPIVDCDIEVLREEVSCIAFTYDGSTAISIPFVHEHGDYWTPEQEGEVWRAIATILENPQVLKRGQNFLFDVSFLLRRHGIQTVNVVDTMVAQGVLYPDFPKGLDFITSTHTRLPYYKGMVKGVFTEKRGSK